MSGLRHRQGTTAWSGRLPSAMLADMCSPGVCVIGAKPEYTVSAVNDYAGKGFRAVVSIPLLPHMTEDGPIKATNETPAR